MIFSKLITAAVIGLSATAFAAPTAGNNNLPRDTSSVALDPCLDKCDKAWADCYKLWYTHPQYCDVPRVNCYRGCGLGNPPSTKRDSSCDAKYLDCLKNLGPIITPEGHALCIRELENCEASKSKREIVDIPAISKRDTCFEKYEKCLKDIGPIITSEAHALCVREYKECLANPKKRVVVDTPVITKRDTCFDKYAQCLKDIGPIITSEAHALCVREYKNCLAGGKKLDVVDSVITKRNPCDDEYLNCLKSIGPIITPEAHALCIRDLNECEDKLKHIFKRGSCDGKYLECLKNIGPIITPEALALCIREHEQCESK